MTEQQLEEMVDRIAYRVVELLDEREERQTMRATARAQSAANGLDPRLTPLRDETYEEWDARVEAAFSKPEDGGA